METKVLNDIGLIERNDKFSLIKKICKKNDVISKHNHPNEIIVLALINGKIKVTLNDENDYYLTNGNVIEFDGSNYISINVIEDSEFVITLIKK